MRDNAFRIHPETLAKHTELSCLPAQFFTIFCQVCMRKYFRDVHSWHSLRVSRPFATPPKYHKTYDIHRTKKGLLAVIRVIVHSRRDLWKSSSGMSFAQNNADNDVYQFLKKVKIVFKPSRINANNNKSRRRQIRRICERRYKRPKEKRQKKKGERYFQ